MNNDIVTKARLNAALGTEGNMGFEHNDIVTVDKMNEAIAEGGGGSIATAEVTFINSAVDSLDYRVKVSFHPYAQEDDYTISVFYDEPQVIEFPLVNGEYYVADVLITGIDDEVSPTVTGDVQIMSDGILITGDGTITMSGKGKLN